MSINLKLGSKQVFSFSGALLLAAVAAFTTAAFAQDGEVAALSAALKKLYPTTKFEAVHQTALPGIFEVQMGKNLAYVEKTGRYFVFGHLYDMSTQQDLTAKKLEDFNKIDFAALPLGDAIKTVRGNGSRKLAVFSDPDCPYCRKLETELIKLNDVTIYTYLYPLEGLHPDAKRKSVSVWCSKDRGAMWESVVLRNQNPEGATACEHPIDRTIALGQTLNITGTPMIISADGRTLPGAVTSDKLEAWLAMSDAKKVGDAGMKK